MPDLALFLTQLLLVLAASRLAGRAMNALHQPRVIGEMIAGLALGPSIFGALAPGAMHAVFPADRMVPLEALSQLGVILFMFVVGLRLDLTLLRRRVASAVVISNASVIVPFALGISIAPLLHPALAGAGVPLLSFALFLGASMSVTAFPVLARIIAERGLANTRVGTIATACAAVDDVTAWCLLAAVVAVARVGEAFVPFVGTLAGAGLYAVLVSTVGRRALARWIARRAHKPSAVDPSVVGFVVILGLASALATELLGVHPLFGAFLAGTAIPRERDFAEQVADRVESVVAAVLLPLFFAYTGLRTELGLVTSGGLWGICALIIVAAVAGKLGGSSVAARLTRMPWREAVAVGLLMNTRGLMELVILNVGLEIGVISRTLFAMMVLMAVLSTVMTSPLLRLVLGPSALTHFGREPGGQRLEEPHEASASSVSPVPHTVAPYSGASSLPE